MNQSDRKRELRSKIAAAERLDGLCDQFEEKLRSGEAVNIESFLEQSAEPEYSKALRELLALEIEHHRREGQAPNLEEYIKRFPQHAELVAETIRELETKLANEAEKPSRPTVGESTQFGERLGRFELRGIVGQGGFGIVYRAYDPSLDRVIALKVPRLSGDEERSEVARLLREARAAAQLRHPNIVAVHDVGDVSGTYFIATDFVEGKTLRKILDEGVRFTFDETARLIHILAGALQSAHEKGVIHRDIKPANILLDDKHEPHLMDFGLARRETGDELETQEGTVMGTPAYMSPEQAKGDSRVAGASSDIWALGVVMFELLTGQRPFTGSSDDVMHDVMHAEPRCPSDLELSVPRELEMICLRCLAKNPGDRYGSCQALADELDGWLKANSPDLASKETGQASQHRKRSLLAISALALCGVLIAMIVGYAIYSGGRDNDSEPSQAEQPSRGAKRKNGSAPQRQGGNAEGPLSPHQHRDVGPSPLRTVAFSPNGSVVAAAGKQGTIVAWDLAGNELWRVPNAHRGDIWSLVFDPEGLLLASGSDDGTVKLWKVQGGENVGIRQHSGPVWCVAFKPGTHTSPTFASARRDRTVRIWTVDASDQRASLDLDASVWTAAFSRDGAVLACGDVNGNVTFWDADEARKLMTARGHQQSISSIAFGKTSTTFATCGEDEEVKVWVWERDKNAIHCDQTLPRHREGANHICYGPQGIMLASVGDDQRIRIWDTQAKKLILEAEAHRNPIFSVDFNFDGTMLATAGGDGAVRLWEVAGDKLAQKLALTPSANLRPKLARDFANAFDLEVTAPNLARIADVATVPTRCDIYRFVATDSGQVEFLVRVKNEVIATLRFYDDDLDRQQDGTPYGVDSHESDLKRATCWVRHEVRAGGVYFIRVAAKDLRKRLLYELTIQPAVPRDKE